MRPLSELNPNLRAEDDDVLYHFGLSKHGADLKSIFGGLKFVCTGGSADRLRVFAREVALNFDISDGSHERNLSRSDRFCLFRVGPVLCVNHGMGMASLSIMLEEVIKLLHHVDCTDVIFFRIGTSGGLGIQPGSVVVTSSAVNTDLQPYYAQNVLGKYVQWPTILDQTLVSQLVDIGKDMQFPVESGKTMCFDGFYESQGRLDGAFCDFTAKDKDEFMARIYNNGVINIDMEAICFAAMLARAEIKGAVVCVVLINRFNGDQIGLNKSDFEKRPMNVVISYMKRCLDGKSFS